MFEWETIGDEEYAIIYPYSNCSRILTSIYSDCVANKLSDKYNDIYEHMGKYSLSIKAVREMISLGLFEDRHMTSNPLMFDNVARILRIFNITTGNYVLDPSEKYDELFRLLSNNGLLFLSPIGIFTEETLNAKVQS